MSARDKTAQQLWYVKNVQQQVFGPMTNEEVLAQIQRGFFLGQELIAAVQDGRWIPITQNPIFFDAIIAGLDEELRADHNDELQKRLAAEATYIDEDSKGLERPVPLWKTLKLETPAIAKPKSEIPQVPTLPTKPPEPVKENKSTSFFIFLVVLALVVVGVFTLLPDQQKSQRDRIRLKAVRIDKTEKAPLNTEEALKAAIVQFRQHTIGDYLKAQDLLVSILETNDGYLDAMGFLCMTYRELWPYAYQDSRDIQTIYGIFQKASLLKSSSASAGVCYAVYMLSVGEYEAAKNFMDDALRREPNLLFFNQLIGDLLEQQKKYSTALYYFQKVKELWPPPPWARSLLQEARTQRKLRRYADALETYRVTLTYYPNHPLALLEMGILEFEAYQQLEKANNLILKAFQSKSQFPAEITAEGYYVLAQINYQMNYKNKALEYANKAFSIDSGNTAVKEFILSIGGRSALERVEIDSSNMLYLGTQYMKLGNYFAAQAEFKLAFEADTRNALAAYHAGQALWALNQSTEAIKWVEKAIHADPGLVSAYVTLANYYSFRHNYEGAVQILKNVQRKFPANNEIYRGFADIEYQRGNRKAAIQFAHKALDLYAMDVGAMQIIAQSYLDMQDYDNANTFIARALEVDPHTPENHVIYSKVLVGRAGSGDAINYLNARIEEAPDVTAYRKGLADIFIIEQNWNGAQAILENLITVKKQDKASIMDLALVYKEEGYVNKALEMYLAAASLDPLDPTPLFQAGTLYFNAGNYKSALMQFERVRRINKNFPRVYYFIGKAAMETKDFPKAIEMATMEKQVNPHIAEPYLLAAEVYFKQGQYSLCASEYQKAIARRPQGAEIYINMARCYRLAGALDSAVQMLDQAAKRESGVAEIYKELGLTFHMQGLLPEAHTAYQRYINLAPNAPDRVEIETRMQELQ
ncbi:MAG: tetratricopeptide repeat protein [Bdellovibrionaceae bacterium]|nr:tetratricopeptide repeat protein [Pseudobdellovibrionaceae bacterium]